VTEIGKQHFPGRVGLQQRLLPAYRAPFFDALALACAGGLSVFAGQPLPVEAIATASGLHDAGFVPARNLNFFPVTSSFYVCWQAGLLRWLQSWQPDVLIAEANSRYASTRLAARWMHARGRPVIGWGLGEPPIQGKLAHLRRWNRASFTRSFDAVIAYSQAGADEYQQLGIAQDRVFVARNAVAPRPAGPPPERSAGFGERPTVLFVGRLQARKRIDLLLQACANLPGSLQPRLIIVGDGPERVSFEALAQTVYPRAEFTGDQRGEALEAYYAQADLFVLPGTGGLAVQQAMAHALPVIVAEADGTQGDLVRSENGWVLPPGDLPALSAALREALQDATRLRRMGRESHRIVAEEVNLEAMVSSFVQALQAVTGR
jgi:glycosyltransferase involved in cell wall biosynthesis